MTRPIYSVELSRLNPPNVHREPRTIADDVGLIVQTAYLLFVGYVLLCLVMA